MGTPTLSHMSKQDLTKQMGAGVRKKHGWEGEGIPGRRDGSKLAEAGKSVVWVVSIRQTEVAGM